MWKFVTASVMGNCKLFDVNIFDYEWKSADEQIAVIEPYYGETKVLDVYTTVINKKTVSFAAAEITPSIYGFALWDDEK